MSTKIKAGTSTTGAVVDADTTGILELQSGSTPTTAVTIDANQNVGIGTSSPAARLDVYTNTASGFHYPIFLSANNAASAKRDYLQLGFSVQQSLAGSETGGFDLKALRNNTPVYLANYSGAAGSGTWQFYTDGSERMRITSGGAVLIGTTSATNTFVASSASGGTAVAQIINTTSSGNVISVSSTLQSNGNNTSSAHYQGNTNGVGNWYLFGNGTSSYSSDERLKKNIETTRNGYLDDLCKLRVVKYNWKLDEEGKGKELGLIAQEVEQVFPNLVQDDLNPVSQDDDTIYKQLKQSVLPFMLLKAIQELNAKVDAQATVIADLTTRLETLEAK